MTNRELIIELLKHDMDATVVLPAHNENGSYHTVADAVEAGRFKPYMYESGHRDDTDGEFNAGSYRSGNPAVVILPKL